MLQRHARLEGGSIRVRDLDYRAELVKCVTLSTFHGCPPEEIEAIARYLLDEIGVDVIVKLNPTLLGYDEVSHLLCSHTHLDHVGNIAMFPNAIHVMQKKELYQGWWPEKFQGRSSPGTFVLADIANAREFNYLELEGDLEGDQ